VNTAATWEPCPLVLDEPPEPEPLEPPVLVLVEAPPVDEGSVELVPLVVAPVPFDVPVVPDVPVVALVDPVAVDEPPVAEPGDVPLEAVSVGDAVESPVAVEPFVES